VKIEIAEVIAGLESENVGRLTSMWTALAFERAGGDLALALDKCRELGCELGHRAIVRHIRSLPEGQRGFLS
jgi:hypothetical protein